ncbi:ATP-binding protein [Streptomyces sp. NPDC016845]|uniref:ATP-binding protein n=1 Tax=Streptomyces sp. NPDC016845 TaxID=3364972 RepID=UPI00379016AC
MSEAHRPPVEDAESELVGAAWDTFTGQRLFHTDDSVEAEVRSRCEPRSLAPYQGWYETLVHKTAVRQRADRSKLWSLVPLSLMVLSASAAVAFWRSAAVGSHLFGFQDATSGWTAAGAGVAAVVFLTAGARQRMRATRTLDGAEQRLRSAQARLLAALNDEVLALATSVVNENRERAKDDQSVLTSEKAPILVEIDSADTIPSASTEAVLSFITEHRTSAIGISGPRGIGKSTLMRDIQRKLAEGEATGGPKPFNLYIPIPVRYTADDFIRVIFRELARTVNARYGGRSDEALAAREGRRIAFARKVASAGAFAAGLALIIADQTGHPVATIKDAPALVLMLLGVAGGVHALNAYYADSHRRSLSWGHPLVKAAHDAEASLTYSHMQKRISKNVFSFTPVAAEDQDQFEQTERDLSHPELVTRFKEFVALAAEVSKQRVVIALDELDKVDKPKDALKFINSIKDILHIPDVHVIVSVSEDALHSFSLRGIPVRDAFDSSFDSIVPVRRLSTDEALRLVNRRALDFPAPLALFCHALSGGVPRDLIRAARHCIDARRAADCAHVPIAVVARTVLAQRAVQIAEALVARGTPDAPLLVRASLKAITAIRAGAEHAGPLARALDESAAELAASGSVLGRSAAVDLRLSATLCRYFGTDRTNGEWVTEADTEASTGLAGAAASIVELLTHDVEAAAEALVTARTTYAL